MTTKHRRQLSSPPVGCKSASWRDYDTGCGYIGVEVIGLHEGCAIVKHNDGVNLAHMGELRPNDYNKLEKEARNTWVEDTLALYDLLKSGEIVSPKDVNQEGE